MRFDRDGLARELTALRKGRATQRVDLPRRLGPQTSALFGVSERDRAADARRRIGEHVSDLLRTAPVDLRLAALAALAVHPEADHRVLRDREAWLATQLNCSEKTARRRVDEAFTALVDEVLGRTGRHVPGTGGSADGWYVRSFRAVMRLDTPTPELLEQRVIAFTRPGVERIVCQLSLPPPVSPDGDAEVFADALYGGRIGYRERPAGGAYRFHLELAVPHRVGDSHEYAVLFRLPAGQPMRPHYAFQPLRPCEVFELIIRFPADRPAPSVRLHDGVTSRELDDPRSGAPLLGVDRLGELKLRFDDLRPGLAYGVSWA